MFIKKFYSFVITLFFVSFSSLFAFSSNISGQPQKRRAPSRGIHEQASPKKKPTHDWNDEDLALMIIDMQKPFSHALGYHLLGDNPEKLAQLKQKQLEVIKQAKDHKRHILFIEFEHNGPTDPELTNSVSGYKKSMTFRKDSIGVFDSRNIHREPLLNYLRDHSIKSFLIAGANGTACVKQSIAGALCEGFKFIMKPDCIAEFGLKHFIYPFTYGNMLVYSISIGPSVLAHDLIMRGKGINEADHLERTALGLAIALNRNLIVECLLTRKASPNLESLLVRSNRKESPLAISIENCNSEAAQLLLLSKADVREPTSSGDSILHLAKEKGMLNVAKTIRVLRKVD